MKNVHALRHEKEKNYYTFMMVVSVWPLSYSACR